MCEKLKPDSLGILIKALPGKAQNAVYWTTMTVVPVLLGSEEIGRVKYGYHSIALRKTFYRGAHFDNLSSTVRAWNDIVLDGEGIASIGNYDVAIVERDSADLHQHLMLVDCWDGFLELLDTLMTCATREAEHALAVHEGCL